MASGDVAVVIPARNEADRIQDTAAAAAGLPGADLVIVVDDGSTDDTAALAGAAGATVLRHSRRRGKAAAMETGAEAVRMLEATDAPPTAHHARNLLFLDADLGATAGAAGPLTEPVRAGEADMTIAVFTERVRQGGHGLVVGLSGAGIERATGYDWRAQVHRARQFADVARALAARDPATRAVTARTGRPRPGRPESGRPMGF